MNTKIRSKSIILCLGMLVILIAVTVLFCVIYKNKPANLSDDGGDSIINIDRTSGYFTLSIDSPEYNATSLTEKLKGFSNNPDIICITNTDNTYISQIITLLSDYSAYYENSSSGDSAVCNAILWKNSEFTLLKNNTVWLSGHCNAPDENSERNASLCSYVLLDGNIGNVAVFSSGFYDGNNTDEVYRLANKLMCYNSYFPVLLSTDSKLSNIGKETVTDVCKFSKYNDRVFTSSLKTTDIDQSAFDKNSSSAYYIAPQDTKMTLDLTGKMVALTYDDGPSNNDYTDRILNALEKSNVKATFFCVGERVKGNASKLKRMMSLSCEIANHTNNHENFSNNNLYVINNSLETTSNAIDTVTGMKPFLVRPPGGNYRNSIGEITDIDNPMILWTVDTNDYKNGKTADDVLTCIQNDVFDGAIILMHDIHAPSVDAVNNVIIWLKESDYQPVTVSELVEFSDIELEITNVYRSSSQVYTK